MTPKPSSCDECKDVPAQEMRNRQKWIAAGIIIICLSGMLAFLFAFKVIDVGLRIQNPYPPPTPYHPPGTIRKLLNK